VSKEDFMMDFSDFEAKFSKAVKETTPELVGEGLRKAGDQLVHDANEIPPKTPFRHGALSGSGKVEKPEVVGDTASVEISFGKGATGEDAPYAARWHEVEPGTVTWSKPGSGPKYLESKMVKFKEKYMAIVAEVIKKGLK